MYGFNYIPDNKEMDSNILNLLKVSSPPVIPAANENIESITLGDNTKIYKHTGIYDDRTISLECSFVSESYRGWVDQISLIQSYFSGTSGKLELISDDLEHYWIVKVASVGVSNRILGRSSNFTLQFICEPFRYLSAYQRPYNISSGSEVVIFNNYMESLPSFKIYYGTNQSTTLTITVNDNSVTISSPFTTSTDYILVDVDALKIARYLTDGTNELITLSSTGDISQLKLQNGDNKVKVTCDVGLLSVDLFRNFREL